MKMKLKLDVERCCACGACAVACMDQNDIDIGSMQPFRRIAEYEKEDQFLYISVSCMHCDEAPCIQGCPVGCLRKDEKTQLTVYDHTNCIGCHSCAMACPVGAPSFDSQNKMVKCDGCLTRLEYGLQPACVLVCPTDALYMEDDDEANV